MFFLPPLIGLVAKGVASALVAKTVKKGLAKTPLGDKIANNFVISRVSGISKRAGLLNSLSGDMLSRLTAGTPVYCCLAGVVEHSGICIGKEIVHLDGSGEIVQTSPKEFLARLEGLNPAINIYYAASDESKPLGNRTIAARAKRKVGQWLDYNVVTNNCHGFTIGCITGNFDAKFTLTLEQINKAISEKFDTCSWAWRCWDGWRK